MGRHQSCQRVVPGRQARTSPESVHGLPSRRESDDLLSPRRARVLWAAWAVVIHILDGVSV